MRLQGVVTTLIVMGLVLGPGATAHAQLAKEGTYSGAYGWSVSSMVHQLAEGHVFSQDVYKGTFFNDAGKGFLHESSWVCPSITELVKGKGTARGHCIVTDKDNDQVFLVWKGTIDPATGFQGDYQWTSGTGKYTGITGNNTFSATRIGATTEGRGLLKGEWKLP
jgi:hypothetical protein